MTQATSSFALGGSRDIAPMSEMNTTPLIDVMLVLLIMFIITVPMQSHQVKVALPGGTPPPVKVEPLKNILGLSAAGRLSWNGHPIADSQLRQALGQIATMAAQPEVHFRPDAAARYERVDEVLAMAARSGARRFGFTGNEQYQNIF